MRERVYSKLTYHLPLNADAVFDFSPLEKFDVAVTVSVEDGPEAGFSIQIELTPYDQGVPE